jgi:hypothetical protein
MTSLREKIRGWREDDIRNRIKQLESEGTMHATSPYVRDCHWLLRELARERRVARRWALLAIVLTMVVWAIALIERAGL